MADGTKDDPWMLKTAPGSSEYSMWRDEAGDPPALVCQVGPTTLKYHLRAIDDLAAWLRERGDWVPLGAAESYGCHRLAPGPGANTAVQREQPACDQRRHGRGLCRPVRH